MPIESSTSDNAQPSPDGTAKTFDIVELDMGIFVEELRESKDGRVRGMFGNFELVETTLTEAGTYTVTALDGLRRYEFTCSDIDELPTQLREIIATSNEAWSEWGSVPISEPVEVLPFVNVWTRGENLVGLEIQSDDVLLDADDVATLINALQSALAQLGAPQMSDPFAASEVSIDAPVRAKFTPRDGSVSIGRRSGPSVVIPDVVDVHSLIDELQTAVREMARHQEAEAAE